MMVTIHFGEREVGRYKITPTKSPAQFWMNAGYFPDGSSRPRRLATMIGNCGPDAWPAVRYEDTGHTSCCCPASLHTPAKKPIA